MVKITVGKQVLLDACQKAQKIISSKNTLPILDNIKFDVKLPSSVYLASSDLETHFRTYITADIESSEDYSFCLGAKLLVDTISKLPSIPIELTITDTQCKIETPSGEFTMPVYPAEEFPLPRNSSSFEFESLNIPTDELFSVVHSVLYSVSKEELRPIMNGVNIIKKDLIYFNSTDAHRLTSNILDVASTGTINVTVPVKPLQALNGMFEEKVKITVGDQISISDGVTWMQILPVQGDFPNVFAVIPKVNDSDVTFKVKKLELMKLLKLATLYSNKTSCLLKLTVTDNELKIDAQDLDWNISATEHIECKTTGEIQIGFNGGLLLDCVKNINCDTIEFRMTVPEKGALILDADGTNPQKTFIMPLMINA
jgi:DNA polymerase-3 subunit beta